MWRLWTRGWGPRDWWVWVRREGVPIWVAWHLPSRWVFWAFMRVYVNAHPDSPGEDLKPLCDAWEAKYGR